MDLTIGLGDSLRRSPMLPMQEHMELVIRAADQLPSFFEAGQLGDWQQAADVQATIAQLEHEADLLKRGIRSSLPKRLWLPVARVDLLALVSAQDKIANVSKDIAGLVLGRQMQFPDKLEKGLLSYLARSLKAVHAAGAAVEATQDLFRSGFGERQAAEVEKRVLEIERLERRTDEQQTKLRARLHKLEARLEPVETMFLYQVLVWIGDIADRAENVGHRLTLVTSV